VASHILPIQLTQPEVGVYFEPAAINFQSNDRYPGTVLAFASQTAKLGCGFQFRVPNNFVGSTTAPAIKVMGGTTATSGAVVTVVAYRAIAAAESFDPSTDQESISVTTTVAGTARLLSEITHTLTGSNFAAGDIVIGTLFRDGAAGADTLAATFWVASATFVYADV
jgi:hypothetical protein